MFSSKVTVTWKGYFFNSLHKDEKLLNEIETSHLDIDADYDMQTGMPPLVRSMQAIPNVNGVSG